MDPLINQINQLVQTIENLREELDTADEIIDTICEDLQINEELLEAILLEAKEEEEEEDSEEGGKKKKWIQKAIEKPGALRKSLKVKEGKDIPVSKLEKAAKKGGKMGKRARLALTLRKLKKK